MFGGGIAQFVEKSIINDQKIGKAFGASFILLIVLFFFIQWVTNFKSGSNLNFGFNVAEKFLLTLQIAKAPKITTA